MLDPYYLDHAADSIMQDYIDKAVESIIADVARRIVKTGTITDTAQWQMLKLEQLSAYHNTVLFEMSKAVNMSQDELLKLFNDVAVNTLKSDDKIYEAVGYDPVPLKDNEFMQNIIWSAYERTNGTFQNLTGTTANTATKQFERLLDEAHMKLTSGAFSYQDVIKHGIRELSSKGIASILYLSGHIDYADVAFRRATLTGLNQAGLQLQERRMAEMGTEYVETTAHAGARPSHAEWQGRIFKLVGSTPEYPNFYEATGYGTGAGLGGWNCRHGFYPYFLGLSQLANTKAHLDRLNNASVTYNGKKISLYEATQKQRHIERQIRKWKREDNAFAVAAHESNNEVEKQTLFAESWKAHDKTLEWQAIRRGFIKQTGLKRDYFRERAGKQNVA